MKRVFEVVPPEGTRQFSDSDLPLAIGSGREAQIPLPEGNGVAAWLADSRGYLFLQAVEGGEPVYHNDEYLRGSVWIKSGDTTRIGNTLLIWSIIGDRVEILIQPAARVSLTPPSLAPLGTHGNATGSSGKRGPLPRVSKDRQRNHGRIWAVVATLFFLLILTSFFLLKARWLELAINPEPDRVTVSGFPKALKMGEGVLAIAGTYTLEAEKAGYRKLSEQIIVSADGDKTIAFSMEKLPGWIDVASNPLAGATVFIDAKPVGTTPLAGLEVSAGEHILRLELDRYLSLEQPLQVTGGGERQIVEVELQPGWGTVRLTSDPSGATVKLDEQVLGQTPLTAELMAGEVVLVLSKEKFAPTKLEFTVVAGQKLEPDTIELAPQPAEVRLRSVPTGAMVSVNGDFSGTTPVTLALPSGVKQDIVLQHGGFKNQTLSRSFEAGISEEVTVALEPLYGTVWLTTDPVEATLFIDGKKHGQATGRLRLTTREHRLQVEAEGFETVTRTILPKEGVGQRLDIRLTRKGEGRAPVTASASQKEGRFIVLGPATVRMGAARREPGRRANEQERTVKLARPFMLAVSAVTNGEFRRFRPDHRSGSIGNHTLDGEQQPVVNISWNDAARYCNWLSLQEGLPQFYREQGEHMEAVTPANTGYRLPTEAEWSFAARMAGRKEPARYPWEGKFPPRVRSGNFGDESAAGILQVIISGYADGFAVTSPVGSFPKNQGGFFDLGGNVSQWCHDWYSAYSGIGEQKAGDDFMGPVDGTHHVIRGSSWRDATIITLRLSYRGYGKTAKDDIGFRVARYTQ